MKPNFDKRLIYVGVALILVIIIGVIIALNQNDTSNTATSDETSTETSKGKSTEAAETTEVTTNALESDYFYIKSEDQKRVIAIRPLEESELPVPYDFTSYGIQNFEDRTFFALAVLAFEKDAQSNTESVIEDSQLEIISELNASHIEQVYKQLGIRYEEDHAIYQHDYQFFVTSLSEPKLYKKFVIYDMISPIESTPDASTIGVYTSTFNRVMFSLVDEQFFSEPLPNTQTEIEDYDWKGKTVLHKPSLTSVTGPSFSKITDEPRLVSYTLGASSEVVFENLGMPKNFGWHSGYYIGYEDLLFFSETEENGDTLTFYPSSAVLYFGEYAVAGIKKGMTFKEVEQIIGPQEVISFTELSEFNYPLSLLLKKDGFSILIGFNANFEVTQFLIRVDEGEESPISEPMPDEVESAFSEADFDVNGLEQITDFASGFNVCYFNASAVSSISDAPIDIGFYTYDLSRQEPVLISDQPMKMVFEILNDTNPSVITLGKEDGILYKIDLNTFEANPVSGPYYKDYVAHSGMVIKTSVLSD